MGGEQAFGGLGFPVPLGDEVLVEQLAKQVAVPPDGEVGGGVGLARGERLAGGGEHLAHAGADAPALGAGEAGVDVGGDAAAGALAVVGLVGLDRGDGEDRATGGRVAHRETLLAEAFLDVEDLEAGVGVVEIRHVEGVAVAPAGGVETGAVVVDDHGAIDDLVAAVVVHVGDGEGMVALAGEGAVGLGAGGAVEEPAFDELAVDDVVGGEGGAGVVAARHDQARAGAVEVGDAGEEAVGAVAVAVAPDVLEFVAGGLERIGRVAGGLVGNGVERGAGEAVEEGEKLGSAEDVAALVDVVGGGVADDFARAVDGAVGGFAGELGAAVSVEVIDHELGVVGAGADVFSQVDLP